MNRISIPVPGQRLSAPAPGWHTIGGPMGMAVFRPASALWAVRNLTRYQLGSASDVLVPGDYGNWGKWEAAVFNDSSGLWTIRDMMQSYLGYAGDRPVPAVLDGRRTGNDR